MLKRLHERSRSLAHEFQTKSLHIKYAGVTTAVVSFGLWLIVLIYLFVDVPPLLSLWPFSGPRNLLLPAIVGGLLVGSVAFFGRKWKYLTIKDMLAALLIVEVVLFGSLWFLTGVHLSDAVDLLFILKWFTFLQLFLFLPWTTTFLGVHYFSNKPSAPSKEASKNSMKASLTSSSGQ